MTPQLAVNEYLNAIRTLDCNPDTLAVGAQILRNSITNPSKDIPSLAERALHERGIQPTNADVAQVSEMLALLIDSSDTPLTDDIHDYLSQKLVDWSSWLSVRLPEPN